MYQCHECRHVFEDPEPYYERTGPSDYECIPTCPKCGDYNISQMREEND